MACYLNCANGQVFQWWIGQTLPIYEDDISLVDGVQVDGHEKDAGNFEVNYPSKAKEMVSTLTGNAARVYVDHMGQKYGWKPSLVDLGDLTEFRKLRNEIALKGLFKDAFMAGENFEMDRYWGPGEDGFTDFEKWWSKNENQIKSILK